MRAVQDFFDQLAQDWEDKSFPPETRKRLADLVQSLNVRRGAWVLDVGTGTGILQPFLSAAVGHFGRVLAFDFSINMLKEALKKPLRPNVLCFQAGVSAIPLASQVCDLTVCFAAFAHFNDQSKALHEMARVTKTGGELVIAHLMSRDELLCHHGTHSPVAGDTVPEEKLMRQMLRDSGFRDPEIIDEPGLYVAKAVKT